jgi:hypothetical protein
MRIAPLFAAFLTLALAAPAFAKNAGSNSSEPHWEAQPLYTTIDLTAGFDNDPRTVSLEAGGEHNAEGIGSGCGGFINWEKPDVDVNYESGDEKLHFYVKADKDTTLVVYTPDRKWVCADDISEANLNPVISFDHPQKGNYNIWVGTYEAGATQQATLYVSELDPPR